MNPPDYTSLPTRFWDKVEVDPNSDCWLWTASKGRRGYGTFWTPRIGNAATGKNVKAHRLAAADYHGPIPRGLMALHHCDNPPCVYHQHLYFGTKQDNMDDMVRRGRSVGHKGERNGYSKLTADLVLEARRLYKTGKYSHRILAKFFGVSKAGIRFAIVGRNWGHLK